MPSLLQRLARPATGRRGGTNLEPHSTVVPPWSDAAPGSARLAHLAELKVRVLDDAEQVAEWVPHRRHIDPAADVLHGLVDLGSQGCQPGQLSRSICNP